MYRKKYKNVFNYRSNAKLSQMELKQQDYLFNLNDKARNKLREIYQEYKDFSIDPVDEDILDEYIEKLDEVCKNFKNLYEKAVTSVTKP